MAETPGLKLRIGADYSDVEKGLSDLQGRLKAFGSSVGGVVKTDGFERMKQSVASIKRDLSSVTLKPIVVPPIQSPITAAFTSGMKSGSAITQQFNQLLRETPNFAIDARIGILSLSNNLPMFFEAMERGRASGLTFKGILLEMGKGLFSVTGIATLAVTAFVAYGQGAFAAKSGVDKLKEANEQAKKATEDLINSLSEVAKARLEGNKNAQQELISLQTLYEASQNQNISLSDRRKIVDQLQQQYPKTFANFKDEIILAGGAASAYYKLRDAIIAKAAVSAKENKLADLSKQVLDTDEEGKAVAEEVVQARENEARVRQRIARLTGAELAKEGTALRIQREINDAVGKTEAAESRLNALGERNLKLNKDIRDVAKDLSKTVEATPEAVLDPTGKVPKPKKETTAINFFDQFFSFDYNSSKLKAKEKEELLKAAQSFAKTNGQVFKGLDFNQSTVESALSTAKQWWENYKKGIIEFKPPKIEVDFTFVPKIPEGQSQDDLFKAQGIPTMELPAVIKAKADQTSINDVVDIYRTKFKASGIKMPEIDFSGLKPEDVDKELKSILSLVESFNGSLQGLFANIGSTIGEAFGDIFSGGFDTSGFDKVLKAGFALPGGAAIAIGLGAVAIGQLLKNSIKPRPFAEGGIVSGPVNALIGEYAGARSNPEVVAPLSKLRDMIKDVAGGGNVNVAGTFRIEGKDLVLALNRNQQSQLSNY